MGRQHISSPELFIHQRHPTNVCPSIHVFATISAHLCLVKSPHMQKLQSRKRMKVFSLIISVLICLSTVFLKQHSVIDIVASALLAFILYFVIKWWFRKVNFPEPTVKDQSSTSFIFK
ncbi:MAG: phosphatase PAP2 family protein [Eubacterium sp.]